MQEAAAGGGGGGRRGEERRHDKETEPSPRGEEKRQKMPGQQQKMPGQEKKMPGLDKNRQPASSDNALHRGHCLATRRRDNDLHRGHCLFLLLGSVN